MTFSVASSNLGFMPSAPMSATYYGQSGYWLVPMNYGIGPQINGWPVTTDANGQIYTFDPQGIRYACYINEAFQLVFQTLWPVWP